MNAGHGHDHVNENKTGCRRHLVNKQRCQQQLHRLLTTMKTCHVDDETQNKQEPGNEDPQLEFELKGLVLVEGNGAAGAHFAFVMHGATVDWALAFKVRRASVAKPGAARSQRADAEATRGEGPVALGLRGRRLAVVAHDVGRQRLQKQVSHGRLRSWRLLLLLLVSWWLLPLLGAGPGAARSSGVSGRRRRGVVGGGGARIEVVEEGGVVVGRLFRAAAVALQANRLRRGAGRSLFASALDAEGHAWVWAWRLECATGRECARNARMGAAPPSTTHTHTRLHSVVRAACKRGAGHGAKGRRVIHK